MNDEALREKVDDLILKILARGRLNQQEIEGKLNVRDMGINYRKDEFAKDILHLIAEDRERVEREARLAETNDWALHITECGRISELPQHVFDYHQKRVAALTNKPKQNDQQ